MENRKCKCCGIEKPLAQFHSHKVSGKTYWRWQCKECVKPAARKRKKAWYMADPERAAADSRAWYAANRERAASTIKAYKEANIDWWRNYMKFYMRQRRAIGGK